MIEKTFFLDSVDPVIFLGVSNSNFSIIKNAFPKLKFVARGNTIKVLGDEDELTLFEEKLQTLYNYIHRYNTLPHATVKDIMEERVILSDGNTEEDLILYGQNGRVIKARTASQRDMVREVAKNDLIFAVGPAGSGKTYVAVALAVKALKNKEVKKIILCRPAVEAEESLGFLPGDMREKLNPYLQPLYDALNDMIPAKRLVELYEENIIQIAPLAYMRGRTLDNAFVILDEAQNATFNQLKMFLTRMGEHAKFIVNGDLTQIDLVDKSKAGLPKTIHAFEDVEGISVINFTQKDIIRHKLVRKIIDIFEAVKPSKL